MLINRFKAFSSIIDELDKAEIKHPDWPEDIVHQAAILSEEAGETVKAALDVFYFGKSIEQFKKEAAQVGAMAMRILSNLP